MSLCRRAIACLCLLVPGFLFGAEFAVRSWDTEQGLPQSSVFAITQTPDGYLWLGTGNGLARFDGLHFTVFNQANTPALTDNSIRTLFADSHGTLWIGTYSGAILMMRHGQFSPAPGIPAGPSDRRLVAACEDADGSVWLLNLNKELWRYNGQRCSLFYFGDSDSNEAHWLIKETNGPLVAATDHRQITFVASSNDTSGLQILNEVRAAKIDGLVACRAGGHWRLVDLHIYRGTNRQDEVDYGLSSMRWFRQNSAVCEDAEGNLVVGNQDGLYWVDRDPARTNFVSLSTSSMPGAGLSHSWVLSLFVDREGTLWVGTDGGGLNQVTRQVFAVVPETRDWPVQSIAEDAAGRIWIAARIKSVAQLGTNGFTPFSPGFWGSPAYATAIYPDREQRLWIGTRDGGLLQFREGRTAANIPGQPSYQPQFIPTNAAGQQTCQAIFQDRRGRLWFGTTGGLVRFDGTAWTLFTPDDGLSSPVVTAIAEDASGDLWIGTLSGLDRLHEDQFTVLRKGDGVPADEIASLLVDSHDVLWVGTLGAGLGRYQNGHWKRYTTEEGLASNSIGYLIEDSGELWAGSYGGVLRMSLTELNEMAEGKRSRIRCRAFGKENGLPTAECSSGSQPAGIRDHRGRLWFPTIKGIAYIDPAALMLNSNPPPVVIQSILVDNREVTNLPPSLTPQTVPSSSHLPSITLNPDNERLELRFTALNLRAPERALFRHRLEGHESDWSEASDIRAVGYSKLPPGHYTFHVIACNEDGVWNERGSQLAVIVQPPIWRTWWFISTMIIAAIAAIAGAVHLVSTQRLERELAVLRQQEALEKERARIARDIHDQVGASLTQVALLGELVEADKSSPEEVEGHAKQISQTARETTRALDEIVWTVNPQNDTLEGLVNYICKYTQDYLGVAGIKYRLDVPSQVPSASIAPDVRHNVFLAAKEAVTNVVRHAQATSAWLRIHIGNDSFTVEVEDNGRGLGSLDPQRAKTRHGLSNMRKRMEEIGGQFTLESGPQGGALARLVVPLPRTSAS